LSNFKKIFHLPRTIKNKISMIRMKKRVKMRKMIVMTKDILMKRVIDMIKNGIKIN